MIKRYALVVFIIVASMGVYLFMRKDSSSVASFKKPRAVPSTSTPAPQIDVVHKIDEEKLSIDGKKVVGLPPGQEKKYIRRIRIMNVPSPLWEEGLKSTLKLQAGEKIKNIDINKTDSFVWAHDGVALFVESVVVTLRSQKEEQSSFRILVDAQSGKILQSWDRPVVDSIRQNTEDFLQVDSRYQN